MGGQTTTTWEACRIDTEDEARARRFIKAQPALTAAAGAILGALVTLGAWQLAATQRAGWFAVALIGVVAAGRLDGGAAPSGIASVMLYIALYAFMTFGAFAIVAMLPRRMPVMA